MDIKQKHEEAGVAPKQRKRKFAHFNEVGASSGVSDGQGNDNSTHMEGTLVDDEQREILVEETADFSAISRAIVEDEDALLDQDSEDLPTVLEVVDARSGAPVPPSTSASTPATVTPNLPPRRRANAKTSIPLSKLFIFPNTDNPTPWEGADLYWRGGIEMLCDEESVHETLTNALMTGQGLDGDLDEEIRGGGRDIGDGDA